MKVAVITIGDEILLGQITDTNAQWIAKQLSAAGITVGRMVSVSDKPDEIHTVLSRLSQEYPLVISTGGLGPTRDDKTKRALSDYFEDTLVLHSEVEKKVKEMFAKMNFTPTQEDLRQAMLPSRAEILPNEIGTAPGMWFNSGKFQLIALPGVPPEMKKLMIEQVLPRLRKRYKLPYIAQRTLVTYGLRESLMSERLAAFEHSLPSEVSLAYLPNYRRLRLRLTVKGTDSNKVNKLFTTYLSKLEEALQGLSYGYGDFVLEREIGEILAARGETLAVAESFTGGSVMSALTKIPGASRFLKGGVVSYSKEIKITELGIAPALIERHSVVSAEVAEAMAAGIRKKMNTDYGIATTGNAGPGVDDTKHRVGDVFLAISTKSGVYSVYRNFGQPREKVIARGTSTLLEMLYKELRKKQE